MYEFEDLSSGFHDVFLNKYADSSGPILDFFISDSMQDMLDIDIRTEVATVVGGTNEFTSLINDLPSLDLDMNSNDGEISWLGGPKWSATNDIYADVGACVNPNSVMPAITSSLLNSPKSLINLNAGNYNNRRSNSPLPSPKEKKSHLTFSPNQIKVASLQEMKRPSQLISANNKTIIETVKKDLSSDLKEDKNKSIQQINKNIPNVIPANILSGTNTIKLAPGIGGLTFANSLAYTKLKQSTNQIKVSPHHHHQQQQQQQQNHHHHHHSTTNNLVTQMKKERSSSPSLQQQPQQQHVNSNTINGTVYTTTNNSNQKVLARNILVQNKNNLTSNNVNIGMHNNSNGQQQQHHHNNNSNHHHQHHHHHNNNSNHNNSNSNNNNNSNSLLAKNKVKPTGQEFPKPAYSYSCLIAMALKNSRSGSLPVSEIYSFMCEHFPYFKTAPNGWKNSVRHNLSLNKCFEKIEKPATNGGQRKGCLWAMNPAKISKMDEEVQKWSRKDPMAIRKAMVFPEHLEALERGEMKHGSTGDSDGENDVTSDVEDNSDSEQDNEIDEHLTDENLIETPESIEEEEEQEREFDIEVTDIYDTIDFNDNKDALHLAIRQNELLELTENDLPSPKRARLDINYSIGPARVFDHQLHQQQPAQTQHQSRRKMQLVNRIV